MWQKILRNEQKTIYTVFRDKESMFLAMVDYMFDSIKESEQQIVEDDALSTVEKIRADSQSDPGELPGCGFQTALSVKGQVSGNLQTGGKETETGWETTIQLLEQGMAEGVIRKVSIPIVKMMLEATVEQFFREIS